MYICQCASRWNDIKGTVGGFCTFVSVHQGGMILRVLCSVHLSVRIKME